MISQPRSQISAFHIEGQYEKSNLAKLTPALSCSCCWFLSLCSGSSSRIPEESTSLGLRGKIVQNGRRGGTRMEGAFCRLKKASFRILFLRCKLRPILIFTGEGEGWPRPPCIQSEAVSPKLRLTEITTLVSESFGDVQNSGLEWWYLLIPSFGNHSSVVVVRRERVESAWDFTLL